MRYATKCCSAWKFATKALDRFSDASAVHPPLGRFKVWVFRFRSGLKFEVQGRLGPVRGLGVLGPRNWLEHFKHTVGFGLLGSGVFV